MSFELIEKFAQHWLSSQVVSVKIFRNKQTSQVEVYGLMEFVSYAAAAERALQA